MIIRRWLLTLAALAAGSGLAWLLHADAGYVLIQHGPWMVETTGLGFALALLVVMVGVWALWQLLRGGWGLPARLRLFRSRRRADRARESFDNGLLLLAEGRWTQAEHELVRRAADHDSAQLNYAAAAIAAQQGGQALRRDHYLQLALSNAGEDPVATLLLQARLLLAAGELDAARSVLNRLRAQQPSHVAVIELMCSLLQRQQDWAALQSLCVDAEKVQALPAGPLYALQLQASSELLAAAAAAGDVQQFKALDQGLSPALRQDPVLLGRRVAGLRRLDLHRDAAALVETALQKDWNEDLALQYGQLSIDDGISQLATVEQWLSRYGERPALLLSAGRVCMLARLWGKARSYLDAAAAGTPGVDTYAALAQCCEASRNDEDAAKYWRRAAQAALGH